MSEVPIAKVITPQRVDFAALGLAYEENVPYDTQSPRQALDIWYPKEAKEALPVIVWIHGGGWSDEDLTKAYRPEPELAKMAQAGFVVASIEYRLAQHAPFPAQIQDCNSAIRFLRASAGRWPIDPRRIGVWGESAGGHLASLVGAGWGIPEFEEGPYPEKRGPVQAVCPWYAPNDMVRSFLPSSDEDRPLVKQLFRGEGAALRDQIWAASPMKYVGRALPAYLNVHGDADRLVPMWQTTEFHEALLRHGCDSQLLIVPGQGHGFFDGQEIYDRVQAFFEEKLRKA